MREHSPTSNQHALLHRLRWLVPVTLSVLGLAYVLGETFIRHDHEGDHSQWQMLAGVLLLSVVGPAISYLGLNWALKVSTRLEKAELAQREQNRQMAIVAEVSRVANRSLDVRQVLEEALASLLNLIDVESGAIWLRSDGLLELGAAQGMSDEFLEEERVQSLDKCLCGEAVRAELPLTLADLNCGRGYLEARCGCEQFETAIGVPVRTGGEVVGVLEVASGQPRDFTPADRELLATIGYQIGTAVEKAQLHRQLQTLNQDLEKLVDLRTRELVAAQEELAQKAETLRDLLAREHEVEEATRARIAGDLHDGVQQLLSGALFETQAVREALGVGPEVAERELLRLQSVLQRIETEMRDAIYSLRPATLDSRGLVSALQECVASFERFSGRPCRLTVQGTARRFDPEAELAAFRIVQEALNNVEAHAQASESAVQVNFDDTQVRLEIQDDGAGFDMQNYGNVPGNQLGLIGMQERAESVGGRFRALSARDEGTRIMLTLPLGRDQ
ncbi:MAG: GAF domain-containing sensor histidine kinase [Chloroflexota bacterium]|nr:MAG: GAF domain-containing sensor histidine kinase [Chloroflexota bacterium]